jgi:ankyrin repeat protein
MSILSSEKTAIEQAIHQALRDVSRPNPNRLKAGLRILLTTDLNTFETVCSKTVQNELSDFNRFLKNPEILAPLSCREESSIQEVVSFIKQYILDNLQQLDNRTAILLNTFMVQKSIVEGEHLKSVIHSSALHNVVTQANHFDSLRKQLQENRVSAEKIEKIVANAVRYTKDLHQAVLEGNISDILQCLSHHGVDINLPDEQGMTVLHVAAREGLIEITKLLLTVPNIRLNPVSNNGWTPLHVAARSGYADIVDALLAMPNINPNMVNSDGWSALHWAAWHGFPETVTVLLAAEDININLPDKNQTTPLHLAARNGHSDVTRLLLSRREIEINVSDNEQRTALHLVAMYNHESAARVLLSSNFLELNCKDIDGLTSLHWAARHGYMHILKALLAHPDISIKERDNSGLTPLDWALRNGHQTALLCLELESVVTEKGSWKQRMLAFFRRFGGQKK